MLKIVMKKKELNSPDLFETIFFRIWEKNSSSVRERERERTPEQTHFRFVIFFLKKKNGKKTERQM